MRLWSLTWRQRINKLGNKLLGFFKLEAYTMKYGVYNSKGKKIADIDVPANISCIRIRERLFRYGNYQRFNEDISGRITLSIALADEQNQSCHEDTADCSLIASQHLTNCSN